MISNISLSKMSTNMHNINGSILELEKINKLDEYKYILMNVYYDNKNVGSLVYGFEYDDINFLSKNCNDKEYELINKSLEYYNYFDKKLYILPRLEEINSTSFVEYKYIDDNNQRSILIKRLKNKDNQYNFISYKIYINNEMLNNYLLNNQKLNLTAIISSDREYNNRLTFVKSFNNDEKQFNLNLIKLVLYFYNNKLVHNDIKTRTITFNQFEDQSYHRI